MNNKSTATSPWLTHGYDATLEKERNAVGRKIAEARKRRGLSLTAFSEHLESFGVSLSRTALSKWEVGTNVPTIYQMIAVCTALGMEDSLSSLIADYVPVLNETGLKKVEEYKADLIASGKYKPLPKVTSIIRYISMPVSSLAVSAGTGAFLDEGNFEMVNFPETSVPSGADFGVRVAGDSMEPVYHDGQIVWVQKCENLRVGEVGVFVCDGEGYLKAYGEEEPPEDMIDDLIDSDGAVRPLPVLISYNQEYSPRVIMPSSQLQIVGRVL